jgi:hypothetical protein
VYGQGALLSGIVLKVMVYKATFHLDKSNQHHLQSPTILQSLLLRNHEIPQGLHSRSLLPCIRLWSLGLPFTRWESKDEAEWRVQPTKHRCFQQDRQAQGILLPVVALCVRHYILLCFDLSV